MDEIAIRNKSLQKEVEKLTALLQLSERKRFNQKILYDKNLENLHDKLADFENVLNKERKEIQQLIQKKDQQIKVREDLTRALQNKLDSQYCRQCGYPTSKNKFDTDWEIDIGEDKKTDKYKKLPPLSLPLPEILPNVSFSNRLAHSKSKLSPVAEECEVASSSYLRNIHADQNQDRFHAVLTASLECLQVDTAKKNITPESEYPEEMIGTPTAPDAMLDLPPGNKLCPRKLELAEPMDSVHECPQYQPPRPSIVIQNSIDIPVIVEPATLNNNLTEYANEIALSILEFVFKNVRRKKDEISVKEKDTPNKCIDTFSNKLAFGILSNMGTGLISRDISSNQCLDDFETNCELSIDDFSSTSDYTDNPDTQKPTNENELTENEFSFENHKLEKILSSDTVNCYHDNSNIENGDLELTDNLTDKPRSFSRACPGTTGETNKPNYSRLSTMIVPLVDQAITIAKTIVRRRSSTNFLAIDDGNNGELKEDDSEKIDETETDDSCTENLSFNRRTLIELIDQAVEQVIPTVNCSKDSDLNILPPPLKNGVVEDEHIPNCENHNHNDVNGSVEDDEPNVNDNDTFSATIVAESNTLENKENEVSKSKKKKSKRKRKKKKSVSDAGNRLPESVDQMESASVNITENGDIPITTDGNLDLSFDASDVVTSSLNNSETEINTSSDPAINPDEDKFSLAVDKSFNEMEASRGSTPDTLDGF